MLFRPESIEHQRRRLHGSVILVQPVRHVLLTGLVVSVTAAALGYLAWGRYDRTETVAGFVAPAGGLVQVYAQRGGTVAKVAVAEGDTVVAGQPLVEVSLETAGSGGPVQERLQAEAERRAADMRLQIAAAEARFVQEDRRLADRARTLAAERASLAARLTAERELLALAEGEAARIAELVASGNLPRTEGARRRQQALAQAAALRALEGQLASLDGQIAEIGHAAASLPLERTERMAQLRGGLSQMQQDLAQMDGARLYILTAPVAGRVAALQASPGQAAAPNAPLVALVPDGADLEAHLLLPSRAAGLVQAGQPVRLRVDAFPFQRFGSIDGTVAQISRATYAPGELLAPIPFQESVYRVVVAPARTDVEAYGETRPLSPGMTLAADIVIDRRSFLDAILDPLRAAGRI